MLERSHSQRLLFPEIDFESPNDKTSSTFADNMRLPVHRWFRYSAGFSAQWVERVFAENNSTHVFDPFAGAATTLLAAERCRVSATGIEAHPFIARVARAKLAYRSDPGAFLKRARQVKQEATHFRDLACEYPPLIQKCYQADTLEQLDHLRRAWEKQHDHSPASELVWLTIVSILRLTSHVGTAPWQYVLPRKVKKSPMEASLAFDKMTRVFFADMEQANTVNGPPATLLDGDARSCDGVRLGSVDLVITSPPYANNFDYADATRLEMCFFREINGWGDLQTTVRPKLVRSCSQHVPESSMKLESVLASRELGPLQPKIAEVCRQLELIREAKGGRKTYHLMVACYFFDMAKVWRALRSICKRPSRVCFVVGDSAPYGVYLPVMDWLGTLAKAAGFESFKFEKTRDRNTKWKNRKHRVPLCEGRLWVQG